MPSTRDRRPEQRRWNQLQRGGKVRGGKRTTVRSDVAAAATGGNADRTDAGAFTIWRTAFRVFHSRVHGLIRGITWILAVHVCDRLRRFSGDGRRGIWGVVVDHAPGAGCLPKEQEQQKNDGGNLSQQRYVSVAQIGRPGAGGENIHQIAPLLEPSRLAWFLPVASFTGKPGREPSCLVP